MHLTTRTTGLALVLLGAIGGCEPPFPAPIAVAQPADESPAPPASGQPWDQPIPQDRARQEERIRDSLAWQRRTLVEAYDRVGKRDPKWDDAAHRGLEAAAESYHLIDGFERKDGEINRLQWAAVVACREALAAGSDDPLIQFVEVFSANSFDEPNSAENIHRLLPAVAALEQSDYPAIRKVWALKVAALDAATHESATPEERQGAFRSIDLLWKWLAASAREDDHGQEANEQRELAVRMLIKSRRALTNDPDRTLEWVATEIKTRPELEVACLQARNAFLRSYAWEARGNGTGDTVTEDGGRLMQSRLDDARRSIERAWALRPGDPLTARFGVATTIGGSGDRAEMEEWFRRAMTADGNNWQACRFKIGWLDPKWYGTPEELIAFGRQCGATGNWQAGLTTLEPECDLFATVDWETHTPPGGDFWKDPAVWNRCRPIFDEYLTHYPQDMMQRGRYAIVAELTSHHADATRQFDLIGDEIYSWPSHGMTQDWIKSLRANAAQPGVKAPSK